jgi:CMP-N,N'-diacetyllegionaminic acid synthase
MTSGDKIVLGVVPARGGSKGVKKKNIRNVCGKPLISYAIECGLHCPSIDHLWVSTDSREIADIAMEHGVDVPGLRPVALAQDTTPMMPVLKHVVTEAEKHYGCLIDFLVLLDPTAPLRTVPDVEGAIALFRDSDCDAVISGSAAHRNPYFNMVQMDEDYARLVIASEKPVGRRQDAPEVFDLNTVVWVFSRRTILEKQERIPERSVLYTVPASRSVDLDTEWDFQLLEFFLTRKKQES